MRAILHFVHAFSEEILFREIQSRDFLRGILHILNEAAMGDPEFITDAYKILLAIVP
jgi:hypothetical protein